MNNLFKSKRSLNLKGWDKTAHPEQGHIKADAVIMFSCISRYKTFGELTKDEIERVSQVWNAGFSPTGNMENQKEDKMNSTITPAAW